MPNPRTFEAVVLAMQGVPVTQKLSKHLMASTFSWAKFIEISSALFVIPALPDRLIFHGVWHLVPPEVQDCLTAIAELSRLRSEHQANQVKQIVRLLSGANIQPVFTKGASNLISKLYPNPGDRLFVDIDFIVPTDRFYECVQVLEADGYHPTARGLLNFEKEFGRLSPHSNLNFRHYPRLYKSGSYSGIEVHATLFGNAFDKILSAEAVIDHASIYTWRDLQIAIPCARDQLLHNILHMCEGEYFLLSAEPASLRQAADFPLLAVRVSAEEWQDIVEHIRRQGYGRHLSLYMAYLEVWLAHTSSPLPIRGIVDRLWKKAHRVQSSFHRNRFISITAYLINRFRRFRKARRLYCLGDSSFYRDAIQRLRSIWNYQKSLEY